MTTSDLTAEMARSVLRYNPDTGKLFWLYRSREMFKTTTSWKVWNQRFANKEAFTVNGGQGYLISGVFGCTHRAHRVIWLIQTGSWPDGLIDHINGIRNDNRWANLRVVTNIVNTKNSRLYCNNKSGVGGVHWNKRSNKWVAKVRANGRPIHLGYFNTVEEAAEARAAANKKYGFGERHGKPLPSTEAQS